jgi:hypothetical protein
MTTVFSIFFANPDSKRQKSRFRAGAGQTVGPAMAIPIYMQQLHQIKAGGCVLISGARPSGRFNGQSISPLESG